ncbi:hypothetical protein GCM10023351_23210 [Microbacterium gilvum]|uniref:Oligosaccharide repeat unit polymerase n=1 Tax=Microbacterium gilvum TaxID=1336204 RepID=A0ABP9ABV1_9MICO
MALGADVEPETLVLRLLVLLYTGVRLSSFIGASAYVPSGAVFWMFSYITLGIVPLVQELTGVRQYYAFGTDPTMAALIVLAGLLAFDAAYVAAQRWTRSPIASERQGSRQLARDDLVGVNSNLLVAAAMLSILAAGYYVLSAGGVPVFFSSRQDLGVATASALTDADSGESVRATVGALGTVFPLIMMLVMIALLQLGHVRYTATNVALLAVLIAVNIVVNNPISNPRYWVLAVALGVFFTMFRAKRVHDLGVLGGVFLALVVFPISDVTRYASGASASPSADFWSTIATKDFDQFVMISNILDYTRDEGFAHGSQILGVLFFWVPRSIWNTKPVDTGVMVGEWMGMRNTNLSSPLWAEGWVDFGFIGTAVLLATLGVVCAAVDRAYDRARAQGGVSGAVTVVGAAVFSGYLFIILRGPLLQASARLFVIVAVCCILAQLLPRRRQSRRAHTRS